MFGSRARPLAGAMLVSLIAVVTAASPAGAAQVRSAGRAVVYRPPVDGDVVEPFRPPQRPYGPGNAGIDYRTEPGSPVHSAAEGLVVFAGSVAGSHHVVVLHPDGLRTTYAFLAEVLVRRGDSVVAGAVVGRAASTMHFGVRVGDEYLDPALLWSGPAVVVLVPHDQPRPGSVAAERRGLLRSLTVWTDRGVRAVGGAVVATARVARDTVATEFATRLADLRLAVHYFDELEPTGRLVEVVAAIAASWRAPCSPGDAVTAPRSQRRIAVLVGGLGAGANDAAIRRIDPALLGYASGDVAQFSYRGGAVPGVGATGIGGHSYEASDTSGDLRRSAERLRDLLSEIRLRHPGVAVDLIAHSQGGILTRLALDGDDHRDPRLPPIATVVTLGSPHQGADLATTVNGLGRTWSGTAALNLATVVAGSAESMVGVSATQLAEGSQVIADLERRPLPAGTFGASIGARGDLVVPLPSTRWRGATHATVDLVGAGAHSGLVDAPATQREVALALAHQPPTCIGWRTAVADAALGEAISFATDAAGAATNLGARVIDARVVGLSGGRR